LQFLVARDFASGVLDRAFGLVCGSFNVFAVHRNSCFEGDVKTTSLRGLMFQCTLTAASDKALPKPTPAAPVATTTSEQQDQHDNNQDQFHNDSMSYNHPSARMGPFFSGASLSGGTSGSFRSGSTSGTGGIISGFCFLGSPLMASPFFVPHKVIVR
jgi:hypothetical protein